MLHRFCCVEDTKAADDRFRGISEIENIFEGEFFEASSAESRELGAGQGPRHLAFGIGRLAASGDETARRRLSELPSAEGKIALLRELLMRVQERRRGH